MFLQHRSFVMQHLFGSHKIYGALGYMLTEYEKLLLLDAVRTKNIERRFGCHNVHLAMAPGQRLCD